MKKMKHEGLWLTQGHAIIKRQDENPDSMAPKSKIITIMLHCFLTVPQMHSLTFAEIAQTTD
jgi:hypothetical protein